MYCRNCGQSITDAAAVCIHCGVKSGDGNSYCQNCGESTSGNAAVCVKCGVMLGGQAHASSKSKTTAGILGIVLGGVGAHNFYLGYTGKAVAQLLLGILGIFFIFPTVASSVWGLIEGIMILTGKIDKDAKGGKLV